MVKPRHHDMGGSKAGAIEIVEHNYEMWEKRVDAIIKALSSENPPLLSTDELRRGIEELGPGIYDDLNYYERWITSATNILLEKGCFTVKELGETMSVIQKQWLKNGRKLK